MKVALIGQGPDELFRGYERHLGVYYGKWWRWLPWHCRYSLGSAVNQLPRNETLKRGHLSLGINDRLLRYQHVFSIATSSQIADYFAMALCRANVVCSELVEYWRALVPQMEYLPNELGACS